MGTLLRAFLGLAALIALALLAALASSLNGPFGQGQGQEQCPLQELVLATTTSTVDSGLLEVLNPPFERRFGARVKVIALGTGAALRAARNGDVDVVLVHARAAEDEFLRAGYGVNRRDVMFNDFVVVGPVSDPAGIRGLSDVAEAFRRIARRQARFVSRGDRSGTHRKERQIWREAQVEPGGRWYLSVGKGMGDTLIQSDRLGAYTLSDRGTYLALRERLSLQVLVEGPLHGGDPRLLNPYGVIAVNPARFPRRNYPLAMAYIGYLTSPQAQALISSFRQDGEPAFLPAALSEAPNFAQYAPLPPSVDPTEP